MAYDSGIVNSDHSDAWSGTLTNNATYYAFVRLSNGKLRVESNSESIEELLELMRANNLPPAEIVANPDALHELFIKSISQPDGNAA